MTRTFIAYTLARLGLFLAVYGAIWAGIGRSVAFDSVSGLYTALLALIVSSLLAFVGLRRLRDRLAAEVASRAAGLPRRDQQTQQNPGSVEQLGESGVAQDPDQV